MDEPPDNTRDVLAKAVTGLVDRHGGPTRVGKAVGADRTTVHRWMRGDVGIDKLGLLASKLDEPVVVRFGPDIEIEAAEPKWARRLTDDLLAEVRENRTAILDAMSASLASELAKYGLERALDEQPPDELPHETAETPPEGAGQR